MELWKAERTKIKMVAPSKKPLFCVFTKGREGGKMDDRQVRAMLKRCADRAGIQRLKSSHGLIAAFGSLGLICTGLPCRRERQ